MPDSERNEAGGSRSIDRRRYLKGLGAAGVLVGIAGCSQDPGGEGTTAGGGGGGDDSGGGGGGGGGGDDGGGGGGGGGGDDGGSTGGGGGSSGPIPVGNLSPFSGGLGWIGPNSRRGVQTALEAEGGVNAEGVLGTTVEISEQDSETNPQAAINGFNTLDSQGVVTMVGPSSSVTPSLVDPAQSSGLSFVSPMTGTIQLDDIGGEYIWRTVPSDSIGARAQATYAYQEMGARSMALAFKNDRGSQSFSVASGNHFEFLGGSVETEAPLDPGANSYRSEVQSLVDAGVDVVSMTAATEVSGLFIQNYVEAGADFDLLLGNDVLTPDFIEEMGADVMEGMVGQAPAPGPAHDQFAQKHQSMHDTEPGAFAAAAYDAMNLIGLAFVAQGEANRRAVPDNLHQLGNPGGTEVSTFAEGKAELENGNDIDYVGASNPQNFDDTGDPLGPFSVLQASGGEWQTVTTYSSEQLAQE